MQQDFSFIYLEVIFTHPYLAQFTCRAVAFGVGLKIIIKSLRLYYSLDGVGKRDTLVIGSAQGLSPSYYRS